LRIQVRKLTAQSLDDRDRGIILIGNTEKNLVLGIFELKVRAEASFALRVGAFYRFKDRYWRRKSRLRLRLGQKSERCDQAGKVVAGTADR